MNHAGRSIEVVLGLLVLAGLASLAANHAVRQVVLLGLTATGLVLSVSLSEQSLAVTTGAASSGVLSRLCDTSGRGSCRSVLASPHSRLFGRIPIAYVGLGFYFAVFSLLLAGAAFPSMRGAVAWLTACFLSASLAAAAWLVYLQARVIRSWCPLCMACHGLNLIGCGVAWWRVTTLGAGSSPTLGGVTLLAAGACVTLTTPVLLYLLRGMTGDLTRALATLAPLVQNPKVVRAAWESTTVASVGRNGNGWWLGAQDGRRSVVSFVHPFCPHCATLDRAIREEIKRAPAARMSVRFVTDAALEPPPDMLESPQPIGRTDVCALLYAIGHANGQGAFHEALENVLADQSGFQGLPAWGVLERLGADPEVIRPYLAEGYARLWEDAEVARWNRIARTPAVFVDERPLPSWAPVGRQTELLSMLLKEEPDRR